MRSRLVLFCLMLCSCRPREAKHPLPHTYGVQVIDACGFCGDFTEWRLTTGQIAAYEELYDLQPMQLYHIRKRKLRDSSSTLLMDSASYPVTEPQADSLFLLANAFVDAVNVSTEAEDSVSEITRSGDQTRKVTPLLNDQGTLTVRVAREHRSKEASAYLGYFSTDNQAKKALMRYVAYLERRQKLRR